MCKAVTPETTLLYRMCFVCGIYLFASLCHILIWGLVIKCSQCTLGRPARSLCSLPALYSLALADRILLKAETEPGPTLDFKGFMAQYS